MPRRIRVAPGKRITLPNGAVLSGENELVLSDADFTAVGAEVTAGNLVDLGTAEIAGSIDALSPADHSTVDHTGLPGVVPGVTTAQHAGIDHTGLPGIPGPSAFGLNADGTVIVPTDTTDSWVVGSNSLDSVFGQGAMDSRAFYDKTKRAFRAGFANNDHWNAANRGDFSFATGYNTKANGQYSRAHGASSHAGGFMADAFGSDNVASGQYSRAEGEYALASGFGQQALAGGRFSGAGDAQASRVVLRRRTTDATAGPLTADGNASARAGLSDPNVVTLLSNKSYQLKVSCIARRSDTGDEAAGFSWQGAFARGTGSPRIVGTPVTSAWKDTAADAWTMDVVVGGDSAGGFYAAIRVTGAAGSTINWVAIAEWVEVG